MSQGSHTARDGSNAALIPLLLLLTALASCDEGPSARGDSGLDGAPPADLAELTDAAADRSLDLGVAVDGSAPTDQGPTLDQGPGPDQGPTLDQGPVPDKGPTLDQGLGPDKGLAPDNGLAPDKGPDPDNGTPIPDQGPPPATEVLLFDGKGLQFTAADKGFDPLIKPGDALPLADWLKPVDYYDGELRMRYVIEGPPGQEGGKLQVCIWTMPGYSPESCPPMVSHTGVGTYENTKGLVVSSWWKKDNKPLDFSHPEKFLIRTVLRGASGCNVTSYNVSNGCWDQWPKYEQMKYRVTLVMVPKGKTFSGWSKYP